MTITVEQRGRRFYLVGNTYPIKDQLRSAGCKWDPDAKAWYTGKRETAAAVINGLSPDQSVARDAALEGRTDDAAVIDPAGHGAASSERPAPGDRAIVAGKATYKGRTYYLAGRVERGRTHWDDRVSAVTTRDGAKVLLYSRDGKLQFWAARSEAQATKHYDRPQTIGRLRRFAEGMRDGSVPTCGYCGSPSCEGARGGHCEED